MISVCFPQTVLYRLTYTQGGAGTWSRKGDDLDSMLLAAGLRYPARFPTRGDIGESWILGYW